MKITKIKERIRDELNPKSRYRKIVQLDIAKNKINIKNNNNTIYILYDLPNGLGFSSNFISEIVFE